MRNRHEVYPGAKIGRWTAQQRIAQGKSPRWKCICECGTQRDVLERTLVYGYSLSCGCAKANGKAELPAEDLSGRQFGDLLVLEAVQKRDRRYGPRWKCRCACGNEVEIPQHKLLSGAAHHCGCRTELRYRDIAGQQFGRMTALYPLECADRRGSKIWRCRCECGNEIDIPYNRLLYGNTRSCGCRKKEHSQVLNGYISHVDGTSINHLRSKKVPANNSTGVKGVYQDKRGKYVARIAFQKKNYYLGAFSTLQEAAGVRREAEMILNDQVADFYDRWKAKADANREWAENNPIRLSVVRKNGALEMEMFPQICD